MADTTADAPSTRPGPLQIGLGERLRVLRDAIEARLEAERDQIVLWLPVALGAGVTAWFVLLDPMAWRVALLVASALGLMVLAVARHGRAGRAVAIGALTFALGMALVWWRSTDASSGVLTRPAVVSFEARVENLEPLAARGLLRMRLAPLRVIAQAGERGRPAVSLPPHVRVNLADADVPTGLTRGATIALRARLMPPPQAAVPGAYDYARVAWFDGIGGTGRGFAPVTIVAPGEAAGSDLRDSLSRHIRARVGGSAGGIADALATGDQGGIADADAEAMRRAGLAHLLSVSGLHITAVVAATMLVVLRLLALSPWLALRLRLPLIAAAAGAAAAIGYTLLTGSQVPTIRSCVAALLVLVALAMGREAMTLRLVAAGAVLVLLLWPESLAGPSFQLSFAAIASIVALHEHPAIKARFQARDEHWWRKVVREIGSLVLTGLVVELALMPIALFHFHKAGLYGAFANIVAIPLTTFVVMPLEALSLVFDLIGLGRPFWWLTEATLNLLLWIARTTAGLPGSVAALPGMPATAFGLIVIGGLWLALWRTAWRRWGVLPIATGLVWTLSTPVPDVLVTGDGRHVAMRLAGGELAMLRDRVGDYTADMLAENGGAEGAPLLLAEQRDARCNRDLCLMERHAGGRIWRILATRSGYLVPTGALIAACRSADIVVSERGLPRRCTPRWLRLDRWTLARTGGVSINLNTGRVRSVRHVGDAHPWIVAQAPNGFSRSGGADRRACPAHAPARGNNAVHRKRGWPDRAGPSCPRGGNI